MSQVQPEVDPPDGDGGDGHGARGVELVGARRFAGYTAAERLEAILHLRAVEAATRAQLLDLVAAADEADDCRLDGAVDLGSWLAFAGGCTLRSGRELVRTARKVQVLPELACAAAEGRLSWEQLRAAARFATGETDADLADELPGWTADQVESAARSCRPRTRHHAEEAHRRRGIRLRPDAEAGGSRITGFLPTEMAATVHDELERRALLDAPAPETGVRAPLAARMADALHDLCDDATADRGDPADGPVVVHVEAEVADGMRSGNGQVGEVPVCRDGVLRHLCDAPLEYSIDDEAGRTVGIARRSRAVPRWLRRRILHRDGRCRFPTCPRPIRHVHHLVHWQAGGPTDDANLVGLCWHHHRSVHEGGWSVRGDPRDQLTFTSPEGRVLCTRPRTVERGFLRRLGLPDDEEPPDPD